jgi:S1-C subfamily serine protease
MSMHSIFQTGRRLAPICIIAVMCAAFAPVSRAGEDVETAGRAVFDKYADSVVTVALTFQIQMSLGTRNQASEGAVEVLATVMNDKGLLAVSNSAIDVAAQVRAQISSQVPAGTEFNVDTTIKSAMIIMPDGADVPAKVVLQDSDLDIAFLQPESPDEQGAETSSVKFTAVPAKGGEKAPKLEPLDNIIVLGRTDESLNRIATVNVGQIETAIRRPRLIYRANVSGLGQPVFNGKGELLGMFLRQSSGEGAGAIIIRPIQDVRKGAKQIEETAPAKE